MDRPTREQSASAIWTALSAALSEIVATREERQAVVYGGVSPQATNEHRILATTLKAIGTGHFFGWRKLTAAPSRTSAAEPAPAWSI